MDYINNEAFWTGVYMGVLFLSPVALWALVCAIMNRSIS